MLKRLSLCLFAGLLSLGVLSAEAPLFSVPHGIYNQRFNLSITSPIQDGIVYYTDDGSDPREKGLIYEGALDI
ncbi:MAG: chitobiase/beta-hexosaminidase C-terminal domain-containing protein, partial [Bacteroidaceae bacterium]|nr:chitobiase/beta-hexosaminidase C-terminal domain-containing protein [Bacteroidaceae bacterium]